MTVQNDDVTTRAISSSWLRGKAIGRGCFGTIYLAVHRPDGRIFAVKSVDRATCLPAQLQSLENEIRILHSLSSSPHVVRFLGDDVTREGTASFRNLHLEFMPRGSLAEVAGDDLDEESVRLFTRCLVSALTHAHTRGFVHCDVKARNVLLGDQPGLVKLADFGSGMETRPGGRTGSRAEVLPRGSPLWMAPEVIRREYQGPESDVWSLGCTVIEMVTGKPPWRDSGADALRRIGFSDDLPGFPGRLSGLGHDFLEKCLRRDPKERWSCDQLLQHPFLSSSTLSVTPESSPRRVLDWAFEEDEEGGKSECNSKFETSGSVRGRIGNLATSRGAVWESDGWLSVRSWNQGEEERGRESPAPSRSVRARAEREFHETRSGPINGPPLNYVFGPSSLASAVAGLAIVSCRLLCTYVIITSKSNRQVFKYLYELGL